MTLGPARAKVIATGDQVRLNDFTVEAVDGRASGNATIARTKTGASRVNANFDNFDLGGLITVLSGRVVPIASKATGKADLAFTGTDLGTATGSINAQLIGAAAAGSDLASLSGDLAVTAERGLYQIQRANLQTAATKFRARGQVPTAQPTSNLRGDLPT